MCTLVGRWDPRAPFPVQLLGLRDELASRAFDLPDAWWPEQPGVIGGRDRSAGGSWCVSDIVAGTSAVVLNRPDQPTSAPGAPSRGRLPLLAVQHRARWPQFIELDGMASFNLVLLEPASLQWWWFDGRELQHQHLASGVWMFTPGGLVTTALDPRLSSGRAQLTAGDRDAATDQVWSPWRAVLDEQVPHDDGTGLIHRREAEKGRFETVFGQFIAARPGALRLDYLVSPVAGTDRVWTTRWWPTPARSR
jgi:Transport and Golgi organisation 2